jgi:multidrug efflux pump subunit AcrA (membrane-fusion protein)
VTLGTAQGARVVVTEGLRGGEQVVVRGNEGLRTGQRVAARR